MPEFLGGRTVPTPTWALKHSDGSFSCRDCGFARPTLDAVRGHRRACRGVVGLGQRVAEIQARATGSQPPAQPAQGLGATRWQPAYVSPPKDLPVTECMACDALRREVAALREREAQRDRDVAELAEVVGNSVHHL